MTPQQKWRLKSIIDSWAVAESMLVYSQHVWDFKFCSLYFSASLLSFSLSLSQLWSLSLSLFLVSVSLPFSLCFAPLCHQHSFTWKWIIFSRWTSICKSVELFQCGYPFVPRISVTKAMKMHYTRNHHRWAQCINRGRPLWVWYCLLFTRSGGWRITITEYAQPVFID